MLLNMVPKNTPSRSPISQTSVGIEEWSSYPTLGYRPRCAWRQGIQALSPSGSHPVRVPLTVIVEFTDPHEHNLHGHRYQDPATVTPTNNSNFGVCLRHEACTFPGPIAPPRSRIHDLHISSVLLTHVGMRGTRRKNQRSYPPSFQEDTSKPATSGFPCRLCQRRPICDPHSRLSIREESTLPQRVQVPQGDRWPNENGQQTDFTQNRPLVKVRWTYRTIYKTCSRCFSTTTKPSSR